LSQIADFANAAMQTLNVARTVFLSSMIFGRTFIHSFIFICSRIST